MCCIDHTHLHNVKCIRTAHYATSRINKIQWLSLGITTTYITCALALSQCYVRVLNDTNEEFGSRGLVDVRMGVSGHWQGRACPLAREFYFYHSSDKTHRLSPLASKKLLWDLFWKNFWLRPYLCGTNWLAMVFCRNNHKPE